MYSSDRLQIEKFRIVGPNFQRVDGTIQSKRRYTNHWCVQGRLIPASNLASVPFIDELRTKMRVCGGKEDGVPDDCFTRLRGALFVGPSWSVTRNKLKLRCLLTSRTLANRARMP